MPDAIVVMPGSIVNLPGGIVDPTRGGSVVVNFLRVPQKAPVSMAVPLYLKGTLCVMLAYGFPTITQSLTLPLLQTSFRQGTKPGITDSLTYRCYTYVQGYTWSTRIRGDSVGWYYDVLLSKIVPISGLGGLPPGGQVAVPGTIQSGEWPLTMQDEQGEELRLVDITRLELAFEPGKKILAKGDLKEQEGETVLEVHEIEDIGEAPESGLAAAE